MADANVFTVFREIIQDTDSSDYAVSNTLILRYLDIAIEKLSEICPYVYKESVSISSGDVSNGYFNLTRQPIGEFIEGPLSERLRGDYWDFGGGTKIRLIESGAISEGTHTFKYRSKYSLFGDTVLDQNNVDIPTEAELPVVFYAIGAYMAGKFAPNGDQEHAGQIIAMSEDTVREQYGNTIPEISSPKEAMKYAIDLMMDLPMAQDEFFSTKI